MTACLFFLFLFLSTLNALNFSNQTYYSFKEIGQSYKSYFNFDSTISTISYQDFFNKLDKLYFENNISARKIASKAEIKIPKIIHLIHFDQSSVPHDFRILHKDWYMKHATWKFMMWNQTTVQEQFPEGLYNQKIYDEAQALCDYATMSKILRYEVLHKFGGLFIEPNLMCHQSFESLHYLYNFYAGLEIPSYGLISNKVIGAQQNHPVLKVCMEQIKLSDQPQSNDLFNLGNWMMRHLSSTPLTYAFYHAAGKNNNRDIIFSSSFFNQINTVEKNLTGFCSIKEPLYIHHWKETHETCTDACLFGDTAAYHFISTDYPAQEKPMVIIISSYNNSLWYKRNLTSAFMQHYKNYRIIYIDDASTDGTADLVEQFIKEHHLEEKVTLIKNAVRENGAAANFYKIGHTLCHDDEIMVHLDGDDWFAHEHVLEVLNKIYSNEDVWMTYGQFHVHPQHTPSYYSRPFPADIIASNSYRQYRPWISHHLRSSYTWLFKLIKCEDLQVDGNFITSAWDNALMYPMLEMAGTRAKFVPYLLYIHNKANPLNVFKIRRETQASFRKIILQRPPYQRLQERPLFKSHSSFKSLKTKKTKKAL